MKHWIIIAAFTFAALLVSCQKPEAVRISNLSTKELTFKENETSSSISFTTNRPWSASTDASWVKLNPISGDAGNSTINVTVDKSDLQSKSATITISCMDVKETVSVRQNQKDQMVLNDHKKELDGEAGTFSVSLNTNVDFSVAIPVDWIKKESTKAYEKKTVTFSYTKNETYENREAKVVFKSVNGKFVDTLVVKQATPNALIIGERKKSINCTEQTLDVELKYNVEHSVSVSESWIHNVTTTGVNGLSTKTYSFKIDANNLETERVGKIIFTSRDKTLSDTLILTQGKMTPSLEIGGPDSFSFDSNGGQFKVVVNANIEYTTNISDNWVSKKTGNEFSVAANSSTEERQATITFKGTTHPEISATVTVKQAQKDQINLKETSKKVGASAGTFSISVGSNVDYSVNIPVSWIKQVDTKSYVSEELSFSYEGNASYDDRSAKITFNSKDGKISKEFTLTQAAKGGLILGEKTKTVSCPAQNIFVTVQYNVEHTVSASENWIHKTTSTSTSELSTKTYAFSLDANTATSARVGKIIFTSTDKTLADTLVITQEKFVPVLEITGQSEFELGSEGGKITVSVASNVEYTTTIANNWVTKKSGEDYSVAENTTTDERQTTITFQAKNYPEMTATATVKQAQKDQINLKETSKKVGDAAGSFTIQVGANVDYDITIPVDWVKQVTTKAYTTDELTFSYESNTSYDERSAKITFASKDGKISKDFTLTQSAKGGLILGEKTKRVSSASQKVSVTLQYNVEYTLSILDIWISNTTTQSVSGLASKTFTFQISANTATSEREGKIIFTSKDKTLADTLVITQEKFEPSISIDGKTLYEFDSDGGSFKLSVVSNIEYTTSVSDKWITQKNGTTEFTVAQNLTAQTREATITFTGKQYPSVKQTVTVQQSGFDGNVLTFSIAAKTVTVPTITGAKGFKGYVDWGDGTIENYTSGLKHSFSTSVSHTITILLIDNEKFTFGNISNLKSFDISNF